MDRLRQRRIAGVAVRVAVVVTIAVTIGSTVRHVSLSGVAQVLRSANAPLLLVAIPILLGAGFLLRAARFWALLACFRDSPATFRDVLESIVMSQGANNVLPLRAGELVRTRELVAAGLPIGGVALAQVTEKVVELVTLLAWTIPVLGPMLAPRATALAAVCVTTFGLVLGAWLWRMVRRTADGVGFVDSARKDVSAVLRALAWSFVADGLEVAVIAVCLASVGIHASLGVSLLVLATVNLAIAIPSTPGQIGALEAGASLGLVFVGVPGDTAIGFALLYRVVQWVPVTLAACVVWALRRRPLSAASRRRAAA
jgi:uncharacterized membrane protein YbhN (UPF0104 family)